MMDIFLSLPIRALQKLQHQSHIFHREYRGVRGSAKDFVRGVIRIGSNYTKYLFFSQ